MHPDANSVERERMGKHYWHRQLDNSVPLYTQAQRRKIIHVSLLGLSNEMDDSMCLQRHTALNEIAWDSIE